MDGVFGTDSWTMPRYLAHPGNIKGLISLIQLSFARERVRHFLTINAGADRQTVVLSGTLKALAADLGLTHEALYRTLARMEADGEIMRTGTMIKFERTA